MIDRDRLISGPGYDRPVVGQSIFVAEVGVNRHFIGLISSQEADSTVKRAWVENPGVLIFLALNKDLRVVVAVVTFTVIVLEVVSMGGQHHLLVNVTHDIQIVSVVSSAIAKRFLHVVVRVISHHGEG